MVGSLEAMKQQWRAEKELNYSATEPSKFRRDRHNLGGTADAHYQNEFKFWSMREHARDMDRNDTILGQLVDRALDNILGDGFTLDPNTGDDGLDTELRERFEEWGSNPLTCDTSGKFDWPMIERMVLRHTFIDGDHLVLPQPNLSLQLLEGQVCTSPDNLQDDVVHGVRVDYRTGRPTSYYFMNAKPGQRKWHVRRTPASYSNEDLVQVQAFDENNQPNVLHIFNPQRITQTRGITAFRAVFDLLGMFEDINFARLVQQQIVSCVAVFLTRERDYQWGSRETQTADDGTTTTFESLSPGLIARLRPGEKVEPFSPQVPNPEFFDHIRLVLRLIGMALGMPLELVTLDTADTTFHGYRGALDQARISFRRIQRWYSRLLHRRVYTMLLRAWSPELMQGRVAQRVGNGKLKLFKHEWHGRGWPYVDPKTDAEADRVRLRSMLISPRRLHAERSGTEWKDIAREVVEDYGLAIEIAVKRAEEINTTLSEDSKQPVVTWRDILNLDAPQGMTRQEKVQPLKEPEEEKKVTNASPK